MSVTPAPSPDECLLESRAGSGRARDVFARATAGGAILLLLTTTCENPITLSPSVIDCSTSDGDTEGTDTDTNERPSRS